MVKLTNNISCRVVMRKRYSEENDEVERLIEMVRESLQLAVKLILGNVFGPMKSLGFW